MAEPINPFLEAALHDMGLPPNAIPRMTHEEVMANRERLLRENPPRPAVAPPSVPKRFRQVRWTDVQPRRDVQGWPAAVRAVQRWQEDVAAGRGNMLALIGPKGTSKTHLAACAAWWLYEEHNIRVPFYSWPYELVEWLRGGRIILSEHGTRELHPGHVRQNLYDADALIIDEVRPTSGTDFDAMELAKLAMQRYDNDSSILITCNWESLEGVMGEPAADRFAIVTLDGPSYR